MRAPGGATGPARARRREPAPPTAAEVIERIVGCLPAASVEMETFCQLASVELVDDAPPGARRPTGPAVRTAAVECARRTRLLLNARFLRECCRRDEHLFLLVMHELWHVILGHTRLYPRADRADEIAFDAVINASLMRQFRGPEYGGLLERLNPPDSFPALLLRPPEGWPDAPVYPDLGPEGTRRVLATLYPMPGLSIAGVPSHAEIVALLRDPAHGGALAKVLLLGDHVGDAAEEGVEFTRAQRALADPLLADVLQRSAARWPELPILLRGRDVFGRTSVVDVLPAPAPDAARRVFARVVRRCLVDEPSHRRRRVRAAVPALGGPAPLPNARDRLAPARRRLGLPTTLYAQPGTARARVLEEEGVAHVYLDVSGSMAVLLPHLVGLLCPHAMAGRAKVFQFSLHVSPLRVDALRRGRLESSCGTDVNPVLEHALAESRVRRVLVVTDGMTGAPRPALARKLRARRIAVHVVLPAQSAHRKDLAEIAASVTVLPGPRFDAARAGGA